MTTVAKTCGTCAMWVMRPDRKWDAGACHRRAYVGWEACESGAPAIDCKRPYGNSSVDADVAEILDWQVDEDDGLTDEQHDRAMTLHAETEVALQIILATGDFRPGTFVRSEKYSYRSWSRVDV